MHREDLENEEPLAEGVAASAHMFAMPADVAAFRERLLAETTQVVVKRTQRRRWTRAAGWGLAYAAGMATAWLGFRTWDQSSNQAPQVAVQTVAPPPVVEKTKPSPPPVARRVTPELLRYRVASAPRDEQIKLLKQAGDLYLRERNDLRSAVQCYQQVLELADTPEQLAVVPEDTWLLAELKNARQTP
ncbi:MAG: hypothetical protein SGJ19_04925 [Planctomycetia bacterium]|nr:hypothetical protein [Planctomycetia bacterium]